MLKYPELLAWEMLWTESLRDTYATMYAKAKEVKPSLQVGWHIWHNNSFNPIYRAEQDLQVIAPHSDFLKIVIYNNCGGERLANYIRNVGGTLYGDIPGQELLEFHYRVLNYEEKSLSEIPFTGLSADYVSRETKRARAKVLQEQRLSSGQESTSIFRPRRDIAGARRKESVMQRWRHFRLAPMA